MSQRIAYAQQYYNTYSGIELPEEIDTELDGENKIKMQNMITEAIRIANDDSYRYSQPLRNSEFYYDCSIFVSRLYQKYFNIPRLDYGTRSKGTDNIREKCKSQYVQVSMTSLQPGDVLWKDGHVGLYIGNNQVAEALNEAKGIVVQTRRTTFTEAYRIIK